MLDQNNQSYINNTINNANKNIKINNIFYYLFKNSWFLIG